MNKEKTWAGQATSEWVSIREGQPDLDFIITSTPTSRDLERAEAQHKVVIVFIPRPENVKTPKDWEAWLDGYLYALALPRSSYMSVMYYDPAMDQESVERAYRQAHEHKENNAWFAPAGIKKGDMDEIR